MRIQYSLLLFVLLFLCSGSAFSQEKSSSLWNDIPAASLETVKEREYTPEVFRPLRVDFVKIKSQLLTAPMEFSVDADSRELVIALPMPDGSIESFKILESPVMHPDLAASYPYIKTFSGQSIRNPAMTARLDITEWGFHSMVMSPSGWYFIEPYSQGNVNDYICYNKRDSRKRSSFECYFADAESEHRSSLPGSGAHLRTSGSQLKTYRLALACTGEYTAFHGGTVSGALSAMVTSVNRVTGVYELEVAVKLTLIANTNLLIYIDSGTDPYTNNSGSTMLGENIANINSVIGSANYDIGHVFSTGGGGVAYLGCVCGSSKAGGVTGSASPVGDNFDIDYVAHEMGHQFGGSHTFNSITGNCTANRASTAAYEPGSGTTIMAYAGICGADDIQPHSDPIFQSKSYDQIQVFITTSSGDNCDVQTSTGNNPPSVNAGGNYTIPYLTPFTLVGSATDPDSDPLTYLWEEYDLGTAGAPNSPSGNAPIFRVFTPTTNPARTFPRIEDLVRNQQTLGEILPSYARTLNFKFTARDNRLNGGGVGNNNTDVVLTVINTGAAFAVTSPNTNVSWTGLTSQTVTWNVSSTTASPISCANVNILLSVDSGYTFPYTLAANTTNDGSQLVSIPNIPGTKNRIKVEAVGNVFFDISNVNFAIVAGSGVLTSISTDPLASNSLCAGATLSVGFSANGIPNSGNNYIAQLSNSAGSFASGVTNIGSLINTTVSSGTISATIPGGTASGSTYRIRVVSTNPVVNGSDNGSAITIADAPGTPSAISGMAVVCQNQSGVIYSVAPISNATGYNWTLPSNASITAGANTNSITVSFASNAASGNFYVAGTNSACGSGAISAPFAITVNPLPSSAGSISGPLAVCQSSVGNVYTVPSIPNASSYSWILPSGATIASGAGTNTITVSFSGSSVSGNILAAGVNSCGTGNASSLSLTVIAAPSPVVLSASGPVDLCPGADVDLSFSPVSGEHYQWRKNTIDISGQTASLYNASTAGTYDVISSFASMNAQSFSNNSSVTIPDNSCTGASNTINVSGYSTLINSTGISVQFSVTHTYLGDLVIMLESPDGKILGLSNRVGGSDNNYVNTVFSDAGSIQIPATGAPYTGTYKPWTSLFNVCVQTTITTFSGIGGGSINPNGNWKLWVYDRAGVDVGTIDSWAINFPASLPGSCESVSNSIVITQLAPVMFSGFSPGSGGAGTSVIISGGDFSGTNSVLFNGIAAGFVINNPSQITATVPVGASSGLIEVVGPCGTVFSSAAFSVGVPYLGLNLTVLIEGYYRGAGSMVSVLGGSVCDTIEVGLADPAFPHSILYSAKGTMNINGIGNFVFTGAGLNEYYYIVVKHRNALEIWSSDSVSFYLQNISYDFTNASGKAFGSNQLSVGGGKYAMHSGDVNQDGVVNMADVALTESSMQSFLTGYYPADLTGDNIVEAADYSILENKATGGIVVIKP